MILTSAAELIFECLEVIVVVGRIIINLNNHFMLALEPFLRSHIIAIEAYMAMVSILYDIATNQLDGYEKIIDITNKLSTA